mmetsp:Transcript_1093/g.4004  ORF Transcript_1093/g.4004 Transcript_1093/m.4004 type:complete len:152 (+) Transcript_1093:1125-1580(+)
MRTNASMNVCDSLSNSTGFNPRNASGPLENSLLGAFAVASFVRSSKYRVRFVRASTESGVSLRVSFDEDMSQRMSQRMTSSLVGTRGSNQSDNQLIIVVVTASAALFETRNHVFDFLRRHGQALWGRAIAGQFGHRAFDERAPRRLTIRVG